MSDDDTVKRLGSGRQSRKDKDKSSKKGKVKEEKEAKEGKDDSKPKVGYLAPDPVVAGHRTKKTARLSSGGAGGGSLSEDDLSSDPGPGAGTTEPYCQQHHMPHPPIEEITDKKYFSRLQVSQKCAPAQLT